MVSFSLWKLKSQSDYTWGKVKAIWQNPGTIVTNTIKQLEECMSWMWDKKERQAGHRQAIWVLLVSYQDKLDSGGNRDMLFQQMETWDIDKSVFYEMKDTFQTYVALDNQMKRVGAWDQQLKAELEKNKRELDASLKTLIELG